MNLAFAGFRHSHIIAFYNNALSNKRVNITGCFENESTVRESVSRAHGVRFNYDTYEDILKDKSVDAVAIGEYYSKRGEMIIQALKAGKHVICDKPLCTSLDELDEIERLARENALVVSCLLDLRYMPQVEQVKRMISEKAIGKLNIISFTAQHCLDFENRPCWYFEEGKHGGTLNDIAIHGVDLMRYITGKDLTRVDFARTWNAFADKAPDFKDCGQFMARLDDISLIADVSYAAPKFTGIMPTYWDFKLWGSEGMLSFNYAEPVIKVYKTLEITIDCDKTEIGLLDAFIDEVAGKRTKLNTFDVIKSQRQTLTIQKFADEVK
ncbi:MAG: Gfo/Idh/MocA family oxidoreductase [Clostridia bacterium]|nr:Gfo/Idh/MocA family oxidoreductase [Clostridia bacterium]